MISFKEFIQEETPVNSGFGTAGVLDTYIPLIGGGKVVKRKSKSKQPNPADSQLKIVPRLRGIPV